jgi:hypothetical protein
LLRLDHPLGHGRQLARQSAADLLGSLDLRLLYWIAMPPQPKQRRHHHAALIVDRPRYG